MSFWSPYYQVKETSEVPERQVADSRFIGKVKGVAQQGAKRMKKMGREVLELG